MLLVERGLAESRQKAQALILSGVVSVEACAAQSPRCQFRKAPASKSRTPAIATPAAPERNRRRAPGVRRGVADKICYDIGASTCGFTDCLLQQGAQRVFAVDVTASQMAWKLQTDPRVVRIEKNARHLRAGRIFRKPRNS